MSTIKIKHNYRKAEIKLVLNTILERLDEIDISVSFIEHDNSEKFIEIAKRIKTVDSYITEIKTRNASIETSVNNMRDRIGNVSDDVERIRRRVTGFHYGLG